MRGLQGKTNEANGKFDVAGRREAHGARPASRFDYDVRKKLGTRGNHSLNISDLKRPKSDVISESKIGGAGRRGGHGASQASPSDYEDCATTDGGFDDDDDDEELLRAGATHPPLEVDDEFERELASALQGGGGPAPSAPSASLLQVCRVPDIASLLASCSR